MIVICCSATILSIYSDVISAVVCALFSRQGVDIFDGIVELIYIFFIVLHALVHLMH